MTRAVVVLVMIARLGASALAAPDAPRASPAERVEARAHFQQGQAYQEAGAYEQALSEYEAAYRLLPLPALLFNMGQASRLRGDKAAALDHYRRYLENAPNGPGADEARAHVAELTVQLHEDEALRAEQAREAREREAAKEAAAKEAAREAAERDAQAARAAQAAIVVAPPPAPRKPLYKRWWLWTAVGGAAVAIAVGVGLGVGLSGVRYPTTVGTAQGN